MSEPHIPNDCLTVDECRKLIRLDGRDIPNYLNELQAKPRVTPEKLKRRLLVIVSSVREPELMKRYFDIIVPQVEKYFK